MRRSVGFFSLKACVLAALVAPGCGLDDSFSIPDCALDVVYGCNSGNNGGSSGGRGDIRVVLTPDSLRLSVGEVAQVQANGVVGVYWHVSDSATIRVPEGLSGPGASWTPSTEVTAIQSGEAWVIGTVTIYHADSAWVVVE